MAAELKRDEKQSDQKQTGKSHDWWGIIKQTFSEWSEDKVPRLAAALAYYTAISLAPMVVLCVVILGVYQEKKNAKQAIVSQMQSLVGEQAAQTTSQIVDNAAKTSGVLPTIISIVVLLFGASGVFGELQDSMNTIWEVQPKANAGIGTWLKARFFSFAMVLGVAFLLIVSLVVSTVLTGATKKLSGDVAFVGHLLDIVISIVVLSGVFMLMFKYLPDVQVEWQNVWGPAIFTGVLFTIGKYLLGLYLSKGTTASAYGAAGSLAALLIWTYYSAQILFFGAEMTQVLAERQGTYNAPKEHAEAATEEKRQQQGIGHGRKQPAGGLRRPTPQIPAMARYPYPMEEPMDKRLAYGIGGLVVGAVAGAIASWYELKSNPLRERASDVNLKERLARVERAAGHVKYFNTYGRHVDTNDRLAKIESRLKYITGKAERKADNWLHRVGEKVGLS